MLEVTKYCNYIIIRNTYKEVAFVEIIPINDRFKIEPGKIKKVYIPKDGKYTIIDITDEKEIKELTIYFHANFLFNFIKEVYTYFCNCDSCCDKEKEGGCALCRLAYLQSILRDLYRREIDKLIDKNFELYLQQIDTEKTVCINNEIENKSLLDCPKEELEKQILKFYILLYKYFKNTEDKECLENFLYEDIECCLYKYNLQEFIENLEKMATFKIKSKAYVNQPPTIGDAYAEVDNRQTLVLTAAMFKQNYSDPEGDELDAVRIDSLPQDGHLELNGNAVQVGDVITKAQLDNNELVFVAPDQDAEDIDTFTFSVRDTGSMQWVS